MTDAPEIASARIPPRTLGWSSVLNPPPGRDAERSGRMLSALHLACAFLAGSALALSGLAFGAGRIALMGLTTLSVLGLLTFQAARRRWRAKGPFPIAAGGDLNEQLAEALVLVGAGYAATDAAPAFGPALGWALALLLALTHNRWGPDGVAPDGEAVARARRTRLKILAAVALASSVEEGLDWHGEALALAVGAMLVVALFQAFRRGLKRAPEAIAPEPEVAPASVAAPGPARPA